MTQVEADVAIVGGGLIGCATAYYLRKRGASVVVLERGQIGGESSGISFGSLRLQGQHAAELPLGLLSQEIWEGLEAELGESVGFAQRGHVHVALTDEHLERMRQHSERAGRQGLAVELLDRAEIIRRWPFLSDKVLGASWSQRDAIANPRLVSPAYARAAKRLGATIHEQTEVTAIEHANGRFTLRSMRDGRPGPVVVAPRLVNAAGAWCGALARQFGEALPAFAAGPVEIVTEPLPAFVRPVIHAVDGSVLFRQTRRGNVVIGGHPRITVDAETRRTRVGPEKIVTNMARLVSIVPHMRAYHVIRCWTGIEGYLPDMMPVVGASETTAGLFHCCAFSGHGLQLGPAACIALVDLMLNGRTNMPIAPYAIGRFHAERAGSPPFMQEEFSADLLAQRAR